MYKELYLTPMDQEVYDPTGRNRAFLKRLNVVRQTFNAKSPLMNKPGAWYEEHWTSRLKQLSQSAGQRHAEYYKWNLEYLSKFGRQGGIFPLDLALESIKRSYDLAERSVTFNYALIGSEWLCRLFSQRVKRVGYPQGTSPRPFGKAAALPSGCKKGDFYAETLLAKPYRHLFPDLPGERYMRKKYRTIHQSSVLDIRLTDDTLYKCRYWLKTNYPEFFSSWLNPADHMHSILTKMVDRNMYVVETDYSAMDEHFSKECVDRCVLPILSLIHI